MRTTTVDKDFDEFFIIVALNGDSATVRYGVEYRGGIPDGKRCGKVINEASPQALYNRLMQESHAAFAELKNNLSWSILNTRKINPQQTNLKFKSRSKI